MLQVGILKGGIDMYLDYNSSETNNGGIDPQLDCICEACWFTCANNCTGSCTGGCKGTCEDNCCNSPRCYVFTMYS